MTSFRSTIDPNWVRNLPRQPTEFIEFIPRPRVPNDETLPIVDRILEPQTMVHFLGFAAGHGILPTDVRTTLPTLHPEMITKYIMRPYALWAPGTHDKFNTSAWEHAMIRIGSHEDDARLVIIEKRVHAMKSRIWDGLVPISETRWKQKQLDDPINHHLVCRLLSSVIEVFSYLQYPPIMNMLMRTYELIHGHFQDFDRVFNQLPERKGEAPIHLAKLWEAYMYAHFTSMTTRAHSWVVSKTLKLRDREAALIGAIHPPPSDTYTPEQMIIANRQHDLSQLAYMADYIIFVHMPQCDTPTLQKLPLLRERAQNVKQAVRQRFVKEIYDETLHDVSTGIQRPRELNQAENLTQVAHLQRVAEEAVRKELRGEPMRLPPLKWITTVKETMDRSENKKWGFTAYRLVYGVSDEDWARFVQKLDADVNNWGENEDGAKDIKSIAGLTWIGGKEQGIPEDDIEAAKKHFSNLAEKQDSIGWAKNFFLAVDSHSYKSYMQASPFTDLLLPGDTGGFVTAVESIFDPDDRGIHADESPHYSGRLRILGSLVYSDLFALSATQTQSPEELWPMAMNHPELIYTGFTAKPQVDHWKQVTMLKFKMFELLGQQIEAIKSAPDSRA